MRTTRTSFQPHERLMLQVGEGWMIRRTRVNHLTTTLVMVREHREQDASETAIQKLVTLGWLRAVALDALWDRVDYEVTEQGHQALKRLWEREGEKR